MIPFSEKFIEVCKRGHSKPAAVVEFVKDVLAAEATYKSHWDAALSQSNVAVNGNELWLAKTLATTGVQQLSWNTVRELIVKTSTVNGVYVSDDVYVLAQSFVVPVKGYLSLLKVKLGRGGYTGEVTIYIGLTDSNETLLEDPLTLSSTAITPQPGWNQVDFTAYNDLLDPGSTYKIIITQSPPDNLGADTQAIVYAGCSSANPYSAGSLRRSIDTLPTTEDISGYDMTFEVTMQNRYQSTGNISIKLDLVSIPTTNGEWIIEDIRDGGSSVAYQAWSSATGAFAGEETNLGTIVDGQAITNLKRYYKVTSSLTPSSDNLTTPRIIQIKANFDNLDRYCLMDLPLVHNNHPFPPIVMAVPQLSYEMDILEGVASIGKVSIEFLDEGFLEDNIANHYLINNEIAIYIGFDEPGWTFLDYIQVWRGNIVSWKRKPGKIILECADWAVLTKKDIPEEDSSGNITPLDYKDGGITHPVDVIDDILRNKINMRDSQIDSQSFTTAKNSPALVGWKFRREITEPTDAWGLISEICVLCGLVLIPREDGKLYLYRFNLITPHSATFDDDTVLLNSSDFDAMMDDTLVNNVIVYYGFRQPLTVYSSGVTWTAAQQNVTGSGTAFLSDLSVGMEVQGPDNRIYKILSIASNTLFSIETAYEGSTITSTLIRPRTDDESEPSSYEGAVVVSDVTSQTNYKQVKTKRFLPELWIGQTGTPYSGGLRALDVASRIISWAKNGIAYMSVTVSLEFFFSQVGDVIRFGSRTTLPRKLTGYCWTKWVIVSKSINFSKGQINFGMMKVPSGPAFSDRLLAYSEWLNAATNIVNMTLSNAPTEAILKFTDSAKKDQLETLAEWQAYQSQTNLQVNA